MMPKGPDTLSSDTSRVWQCGGHVLSLDRTLVMGILNVTPDSFSDGGRFSSSQEAVAEGLQMVEQGADLLDVGGESTRPGAAEVSEADEIRRVVPVVAALSERAVVPISIDTRHPAVAEACIREGASVINDVSGFRDPVMRAVVAASDAGCVIMHMLGEPRTMQSDPFYRDVVEEVRDYLVAQAAALGSDGVAPERIALDPGIGFGKTLEHNLALLRGIEALIATGYAVLVGVSRKAFIGAVLGLESPADRVAGSVGIAAACAVSGVDVVRVHDVHETVDAVRMVDAVLGRGVEGRKAP